MAAAQGHADAVQLLLRHGADPNVRDGQERTALHAVALWGTYTMMVNKAILASLTEPRARGAAACAQLLVAAGADVNAADDIGATPLVRLAQVQMDDHVADTMRLLLAAGADGRPALEAALHWENLAALEVLIAAGTDASELLAAKLDYTQRRRMAADDALLLLRAGARIEGLPLRLQQFGVELALRDHAERLQGCCSLVHIYNMSGTQSGGAVEPIAARLAAWRAIHASLPPNTFFVYRPNLKAEGLAIMTSRDFLSLVEAMQQLLGRAGVRGLAALAQQQQDSVVGQLAATVLRGDRLHYAEGFVVPVCCTCGKADGGHLLRCAKCRTAGYCSKECQRRQWGAHKKVCAHMAAEMEGVSRSAQRAQHAAAPTQEAGDRAAAAGSWGVAIQRWDAALAASPADPHKLHEAKAQVWLEVGEDWKAVQSARRAVELRPEWPEGHLTLSRAQLNFGEPELALQSMERVLQLAPSHPEAAAEVASIRSLVLQRRQGGSGGGATGQRAQVVPRPGDGGSNQMET
ncbi:Tetratricopeptide repeat 33 [Chlorella sorokiniana]|uniref:Tetratricopeptide repeat 33 n=1 Tax=Chlorella sorokiniana TaxID=3076 RepID=A0A2P6TL09_CHLSO|nr:Tetratricopeptide repeat 33 [Chlorella sorokiniana]|eukprot:PRW44936.1 Tetratricopeptide repeat 33 [Chlorella sorokiniana]